jgi:hypothetical protein
MHTHSRSGSGGSEKAGWKTWLKPGKIGGKAYEPGSGDKPSDVVGYDEDSSTTRVVGAQQVVKRGSVANLASVFGGSVAPQNNKSPNGRSASFSPQNELSPQNGTHTKKSPVFDSNTDGYGNTRKPSLDASAALASRVHSRNNSAPAASSITIMPTMGSKSSSSSSDGSDSSIGSSIKLILGACKRQAALAQKLHDKEVRSACIISLLVLY